MNKVLLCLIVLSSFSLCLSAQGRPKKADGNWSPPEKTIKGKVIDSETGQGLEFATISIFNKKDNTVAGGGLSETDGSFSFKVKAGKIYAVIEFISYESFTIDPIITKKGEPEVDLGEISLSPDAVQLEDVEIVAERSETTFSLDKKVFTVGKDLANRGGSAEDVLNNVPSLDVDIEGAVSLRGNEGVRILIDGKPSSLVGVGNSNGLKNIPSNLIEQVEVITNPSARYEAEGMAGIVNIILKKKQGHGFNGSVDLTTGIPTTAGISANLNYRKGPLNWFANYGTNYRTGPGGGYSIQDQLVQGVIPEEIFRRITTLDRDINRSGLSNSLRFGVDYFLSDKSQLTGSFYYRKAEDDNSSSLLYKDYSTEYGDLGVEPLWLIADQENFLNFDNFDQDLGNTAYIGATSRTDDEIEKESNLEYSLNYKKEYSSREHALNASIQYRDKGETEENQFGESFSHNYSSSESYLLNQSAENEEKEKTWALQLDYVKPLGKDQKWEAGLRGALRDIDTKYLVQELIGELYVPLPGLNSAFDYDEDIFAAYGIYGNRTGNISYQLGLRGEYSLVNTKVGLEENIEGNKRNYANLFPSGHLSLHLNETDALQLSYSRRVNRPRFWDLNPFFTFQDSRNYFSGNPNLDPEYTDSYEIGQIKYWDGVSLSSSLFYRRTTDSRQRFLSVDKLTATTLRIPINIGTTNDYGLDISIGYTAMKWLRINFNTNIFRNQLSLNQGEVENEVYLFYTDVREIQDDLSSFKERYSYVLNETDNITWNGKLTARFSFWKSDLQLRGNYRGPRESTQGNSKAVSSIDIGWSRDFLTSKNLTLTLSVRDLFNSRKRNGRLFLDDYFQQSEFQWRSRAATITASYRINQKKKRGGSKGSYEGQGGGEF